MKVRNSRQTLIEWIARLSKGNHLVKLNGLALEFDHLKAFVISLKFSSLNTAANAGPGVTS